MVTIITGPVCSGKSTLLNKLLIGKTINIPFTDFYSGLFDNNIKNYVCGECGDLTEKQVAFIRDFVIGAQIPIDRKYQKPFVFNSKDKNLFLVFTNKDYEYFKKAFGLCDRRFAQVNFFQLKENPFNQH